MKMNLVFLFLFATGVIWGQHDQTIKSQKWQISISPKVGGSYHFSYAENFLQCIEGCQSVDQDPKIGYGISAGLGYHLNPSNELHLEFGYSQHRFKDFSHDYFSGSENVFETDVKLNFVNIGLGHRLYAGKLFFENLVGVDLKSGSSAYFAIKDAGLNYQLHFGLNHDISDSNRLLIGPYFKTAISDYYRYQPRYHPYSVGVKVSFTFKL